MPGRCGPAGEVPIHSRGEVDFCFGAAQYTENFWHCNQRPEVASGCSKSMGAREKWAARTQCVMMRLSGRAPSEAQR
jgi:hypothetical protein